MNKHDDFQEFIILIKMIWYTLKNISMAKWLRDVSYIHFFLNSDYMNDNLSENRPRSTKRSIKSRAAVLGLGINQNILEQLCEDSNDQKIFLNGYFCAFLSWALFYKLFTSNRCSVHCECFTRLFIIIAVLPTPSWDSYMFCMTTHEFGMNAPIQTSHARWCQWLSVAASPLVLNWFLLWF